jgi:hypothetical protein
MWMTTYIETVRMEELEHFLRETVPTSYCWPPRHNTPRAVANASREKPMFSINLLVKVNRPSEAIVTS